MVTLLIPTSIQIKMMPPLGWFFFIYYAIKIGFTIDNLQQFKSFFWVSLSLSLNVEGSQLQSQKFKQSYLNMKIILRLSTWVAGFSYCRMRLDYYK